MTNRVILILKLRGDIFFGHTDPLSPSPSILYYIILHTILYYIYIYRLDSPVSRTLASSMYRLGRLPQSMAVLRQSRSRGFTTRSDTGLRRWWSAEESGLNVAMQAAGPPPDSRQVCGDSRRTHCERWRRELMLAVTRWHGAYGTRGRLVVTGVG